jgi:hypothetical protein
MFICLTYFIEIKYQEWFLQDNSSAKMTLQVDQDSDSKGDYKCSL